MVRYKVLARHALTGVGVLALLTIGSGIAYQAAGAALTLGSTVFPR